MKTIKIFIPGRPKAKQSFKVGKGGGYQPIEIKRIENKVKKIALKHKQVPLLNEPLRCHILHVFKPPGRLSKKRKEFFENDGMERMTLRPDLTDNLNKLYFDCLTGIIYKDDALICDFHAYKMRGLPERTEITIEYDLLTM